MAHFPVRYLAVVFRPFKNEILPAKVTTINSVRIKLTDTLPQNDLMPAISDKQAR